ncbi:hypothetical protein H0H93_013180, partial [Arthromyces matolae]
DDGGGGGGGGDRYQAWLDVLDAVSSLFNILLAGTFTNPPILTMRIYSIAIPAYLSSTILFATALPTPFPTSRGLSPCIAVGTDSIHDLTLNNVCNEADRVTRLPPTTFGDERERDLQPRGNPKKPRDSVTIPQSFRNRVSDLPVKIYKPLNHPNVTPEEQSHVDKTLRKIAASVAGLGYKDKLSKQFATFKILLKVDLGYDVQLYKDKKRYSVKIPSALRENQPPDLPERIYAPADPSDITPQERSHVQEILEKLYTRVADLGPDDDLRKQFINFKSHVKLQLGYDVKSRPSVKIPSPLRDNLPDLPERIFAPHDPLNITPEEKQLVFDILQRLKASIARFKSSEKPRQQFYQLKSDLHRVLGYKNNEDSAPK